ncbi:MAG: hypothetical protein NWF10_03215 [Candidatus Bathyarchaeota archaeon]|nr:hypothetical protein [Candidatus Bathyarchaeota archaeon]
MTKTKEEMEQHIKQEIQQSGFPLEIKSALIFKKSGWKVVPHILYFNEKTQKNKEIDLTAFKFEINPEIGAKTNFLVIECKKQETKPWIFFEDEKVTTENNMVIAYPRKNASLWLNKYFNNHHYYNQKPCSFHFPVFPSTKEKSDVILSAINQVIDGLDFHQKA